MECLTYFYPNHPDYECPNCGGKTRPSQFLDPSKHEIFEESMQLPLEKKCSNCSTVMVPGMITEAAESIGGLYYHGSVRWTAHGPRFIFPPVNSFFPTAYACPKCGKIELYIQLIEDTEKPREEKITNWVKDTELIGYCLSCKKEYNFYENGYICPICKKKETEKREVKITNDSK
jgi:hypothetical protein